MAATTSTEDSALIFFSCGVSVTREEAEAADVPAGAARQAGVWPTVSPHDVPKSLAGGYQGIPEGLKDQKDVTATHLPASVPLPRN